MKIMLALLLLVIMTAAAAQEVYRWVDKNGEVHYTQTPPPSTSVHTSNMVINAPPPDPTAARDAQNLVQQMQQAKANQAQSAQQQAQVEAEKRAHQQRCNQLMSRLQILEQVGPVATVDAKGNRTYWTDTQHTQAEQQLQNEINAQCNSTSN